MAENSELTHEMRYNRQLSMNVKFIRKDIRDHDFTKRLDEELEGRRVDVICGGPPCQGFSMAGERAELDRRDDLFKPFLKVVEHLRPKYFIMENVSGILSKYKGILKDRIVNETKSIADSTVIPKLAELIEELREKRGLKNEDDRWIGLFIQRLNFELTGSLNIFKKLLKDLESCTKKIGYRESRSSKEVRTVRNGLELLRRKDKLEEIRKQISDLKEDCHLGEDMFVPTFQRFLDETREEKLIDKISKGIEGIDEKTDPSRLRTGLEILSLPSAECLVKAREIVSHTKGNGQTGEKILELLQDVQLYDVVGPIRVNASDYGVPQNRERVIFIGTRKDQAKASNIPPTVSGDEKVTAYEALHDLEEVGIGKELVEYPNHSSNENNGLPKRLEDGRPEPSGKMYSEWSREGRRLRNWDGKPYAKDRKSAKDPVYNELQNHRSPNHRRHVQARYKIIRERGGYEQAKKELDERGLLTGKRNYSLISKDEPTPTVTTIPDSLVHYSKSRTLTVRELARLQSFDDSFVFQGNVTTGGRRRKNDLPQYTLVGNAVPPLMARAIGMEILKKIK